MSLNFSSQHFWKIANTVKDCRFMLRNHIKVAANYKTGPKIVYHYMHIRAESFMKKLHISTILYRGGP